ncbi:MAG: 30S ribosomal protein S6 [Anaerovoracaceae bacterium]|jgi:small subunit ribosomal protein S6
MVNYELMYILDSSLEEDKRNAVQETVQNIITGAGGELGEADVWGMRKLAYPIDKKNEGFYVVLPFKADSSLPKELDRRLRINDSVIRHMIINKDAK